MPPRPLDGPRRPAASGRARMLVVLLHGYGADGNDLIAFADYWRPLLPDAAFASPYAPEACAQNPAGRQWFGFARFDAHEIALGCERARPDLDAFLDAELARLQLQPGALALVGFSQGTMMSLHTSLRRAVAPLAVVGFSGALSAPPRADEVKSRPPTLLVHGDADPTLPVEATFAAASALGGVGVPVIFHTRPGLGHGIDEVGLKAAGLFLADAHQRGPTAFAGPVPIRV